MMILKCLAAAFVLYLIAVFIVAVIGGIIQKVRKKARHRRTTIPVREGRERDGRLRRLFRDRIIKRTNRQAEL